MPETTATTRRHLRWRARPASRPRAMGWALAAALGWLAGCDSGGEDAAPPAEDPGAGTVDPDPTPAATEGEPRGGAEEAPGPVAAGDGYAVEATLAGPYMSGEVGSFAVSLAAKEQWHLNEDYPTRVIVQGSDAVVFPKAELAKTDAANWSEDAARFDVPFSAGAAGEHPVQAVVKFAICTEETCIPTERTLALNLPVE